MKARSRKKSWAEKIGVLVAPINSTLSGVKLSEDNRVTNWYRYKAEIKDLLVIQTQFKRKNIRAIVAGVMKSNGQIKYAVFIDRS